MTLQNVRATVFAIVNELRHVPFAIAGVRKPLRAVSDSLSPSLRFQSGSLLFENVVKQFLRPVRAVNVLGCFQQVQCELVAVGLKKIVGATSKPIDHLGSSHSLWAAPSVQISIAMQSDAMLFNSHVAHPHFVDELVDRQALGALEGVDNIKALRAANFRD